MATESEVARLIVRLIGDNKEYRQMFQGAKDVTDELNDAVVRVTKALKETAATKPIPNEAIAQVRKATEAAKAHATAAKEQAAALNQASSAAKGNGDGFDDLRKRLENARAKVDDMIRAKNEAAAAGVRLGKGLTAVGVGLTTTGLVLAPVAAAFTKLGSSMLDAFARTQDSLDNLKATLFANGREIDTLMAKYNEFATKTSKAHFGTSRGQVRELVRMAETMGLTGEAAMRAAENAIGLNQQLGIGGRAAVRLTSRLEQGSTEMLQRYIPALTGVKNEADRVRIAHEHLSRMVEASARSGDTIIGKTDQLRNEYEHLLATMGVAIGEAWEPMIDKTRELVRWLDELSPATKRVIAYVGASVVALAGLATVVGTVVTAMGALQLASTALGLSLAGVMATLGPIAAGVLVFSAAAAATHKLIKGSLNEALEESEEVSKRAASAYEAATDAMIRQAKAMQGPRQGKFLDQGMEQATRTRDKLMAEQERLTKQIANMDRHMGARFVNNITGDLPTATQQLENLTREFDKVNDRIKQINDLRSKGKGFMHLLDPEQQAALQKAADSIEQDVLTPHERFKQTMRELNTLNMNVWKNSERGAEIYRRAVAKAREELDEALNGKQREEALKRQQEIMQQIERVTQDTLTPMERYNQTVQELEFLLSQGLGQDAFNRAMKEAREEMEKASKTAEQLKAEKLIEQFRTPMQQFKDTAKELQELRSQGLIDSGTHQRAFEEARKQFDELTKEETKTIKIRFGGIDAAEAGSAEALARMEEFFTLRRRGGSNRSALPPGIEAPAGEPAAPRFAENPLRRDQYGRQFQIQQAQNRVDFREHSQVMSHSGLAKIEEHLGRLVEIEENKDQVTLQAADLN